MARLDLFERIARTAHQFSDGEELIDGVKLHPFDRRTIHQALPSKTRNSSTTVTTRRRRSSLQISGQARSETLVDQRVGYKLMMEAFNDAGPKIKLTPLTTTSEIDEQKGFRFVFAGSVWAIRNPRGHEFSIVDDPDTCLDHLAFISMLIRRLEQAGYNP